MEYVKLALISRIDQFQTHDFPTACCNLIEIELPFFVLILEIPPLREFEGRREEKKKGKGKDFFEPAFDNANCKLAKPTRELPERENKGKKFTLSHNVHRTYHLPPPPAPQDEFLVSPINSTGRKNADGVH